MSFSFTKSHYTMDMLAHSKKCKLVLLVCMWFGYSSGTNAWWQPMGKRKLPYYWQYVREVLVIKLVISSSTYYLSGYMLCRGLLRVHLWVYEIALQAGGQGLLAPSVINVQLWYSFPRVQLLKKWYGPGPGGYVLKLSWTYSAAVGLKLEGTLTQVYWFVYPYSV